MDVSTPPQLLERLARDERVWLTTLRPDGSPHTTPVWFVFWEDRWWFVTGDQNRKLANLRTDSRVSLALEDGTAPVVAEGRAHLHTDPASDELSALFAGKYDGWAVRAPERPGVARVLVEVTVTRWLLTGIAQ